MTEEISHRARVTRLQLEARGHEVVTCGDETDRPIVCAALRGEPCALSDGTVDVAVHPAAPETPGMESAGLLCALRHFVPLVVTAPDPETTNDPFTAWAAAVCDAEHLDEALDKAVAAPLVAHGEAAERGANGVLVGAGEAPTWHAVVHRIGPRLRVELRSEEPVAEALRNASAVRAASLVRELDSVSPVLDVVVVTGG